VGRRGLGVDALAAAQRERRGAPGHRIGGGIHGQRIGGVRGSVHGEEAVHARDIGARVEAAVHPGAIEARGVEGRHLREGDIGGRVGRCRGRLARTPEGDERHEKYDAG